MVAEETGDAASAVSVRRGWASAEEEVIPLDEFRDRTDEARLDDGAVALRITVVGADDALRLKLEHLGLAPSSDCVQIFGCEKSLVEGVKERVKLDGEVRVARAREAREPKPEPRAIRALRKIRAKLSNLPGRESAREIVIGVIILLLGAMILAYVLHLPSP